MSAPNKTRRDRHSRAQARGRESIQEVRGEVVRRALLVAERPQDVALTAAAIAALKASGRLDFRESEIQREAELLAAELRRHVGFPEACREAAVAVWQAAERVLEGRLAPAIFLVWIEPLEPVGLIGERLWVRGPSRLVDHVSRRFKGPIEEALEEATGLGLEIRFVGLDDPDQEETDDPVVKP